ncbi:protein Spindly-B-like [Panulirus ornatus]|uniref:protein Spindly-B-like n=1 Tax=Panulirus ornatus TaxID=150431 RepID=UPI003A874A1F
MSGDQSLKLAELQQRLDEAEKNTITAAMYGKQLLDENHELHTKLEDTIKEYAAMIEVLEQEKHCIGLKLEAKLQTEHSLAREIELLREQQNQQIQSLVAKATQCHEQELQKNAKKVSNLETTIESLHIEASQSKEYVVLLEAQLKEAQERLDMCNSSIHEQSTDETTASLQSQIMTLTCEKQELELKVSSLTAQIKTDKHKLLQAEKNVAKLEANLEESECQSTSYFNALEKSKEEIMELKMEIESLKLGETDPAKKGNSLFAEVEDQRQAMEKQLLSYKTNYNVLKKQCDLKTQQISKMKLQLASLLSMNNSKVDNEYMNHLEESLASARTQLEMFTKRCQDLEAQQTNTALSKVEIAGDGQDINNLFRHMYTESQKKVCDLDQALNTAQFDKVVLSDRILQLQRKLHQAEAARNAVNAEAITLRVRLEEMAAKKGEKIGTDFKEVKMVKEKIPGFEKLTSPSEKIQSSTPKEIISLKEKLVDPKTMQEIDVQVKNMSKCLEGSVHGNVNTIGSGTIENEKVALPSEQEQKKKTKKSVHMTETVAVQEYDGQVQNTQMKREDGVKKIERKKMLRKMEAPLIKVTSGGHQEECKQQ